MRKNKSYIILIVAVLCAFFLLSACTDFGLYYDDDKAIATKSSVTRVGSIVSKVGNYYSEKTRKFNGVYNIATEDLPENALIEIKLTIDRGDLKVVLVNENDEVMIVTDKSVNDKIQMKNPPGRYKLKVVGRDAGFEMNIRCKNFME